jgi:septal ring factor EnvC (AmiA/AmiB activator)
MRKPFDGDFPLTQEFNDSCCRDSYTQFGLKGHNGLDYGCPTGTKILAPHDGKIIEATLDPKGYGIYVKIENTIEGSVLAHLKEYRVGVGDGVKEGDLVGYSDNSGNSTGQHLHWGYYRFPRDRKNGFNGYIDQTSYIGSTLSFDIQAELDKCVFSRNSHWDDLLKIKEALVVVGEYSLTAILTRIDQLSVIELQLPKKDEEISKLKEQAVSLQQELEKALQVNTEAQKVIEEHRQVEEALKSEREDLVKKLQDSEDIMRRLGDQVEQLKKVQPIEAYTPWELIFTGLRKLLQRR